MYVYLLQCACCLPLSVLTYLLSTSHCIVNRAEKADFFPKPTGNLLPFFSSLKLPQFLTQSIKAMHNLESSEPIYSFTLFIHFITFFVIVVRTLVRNHTHAQMKYWGQKKTENLNQ